MPSRRVHPTDLTVENGDTTLAVRDHGGNGTPVLLLHGASRTLADWSGVATELTAGHRVVSMDLRAHGRSSSGSGPWTIPAVLGDIEAVLERLGIPEAVPVGHSLGGMLAALYADAHPRTPAAVNLDGFGWGRPEQYAGRDPEAVVQDLDRAHAFARAAAGRTFPPEALDSVRERTTAMGEKLGIAPELFEEGFRRSLGETEDGQLFLRPERERAVEMLAVLRELDMFPVYRRLTCPVLIVRAERLPEQGGELAWFDALMAAFAQGLRRDLDELAVGHPHVTVGTVDATHAMLLECPRTVAADIRAFTNRPHVRT
ncbi:alpha/beta fold hydrolase [Streptomyces hygroscopicus]|uniref:alpha/beta fold hydrolase n=1 Tax=Streptomyces hygroscopicus TaxID=1912 RepID=UPI003645753D